MMVLSQYSHSLAAHIRGEGEQGVLRRLEDMEPPVTDSNRRVQVYFLLKWERANHKSEGGKITLG